MKKLLITLIAISFIIPSGCKKKQEEKKEEVTIAKKYARYKIVVNKDKELKGWLATLEKAEEVGLLAEENYTNQKGKQLVLTKVKLADDTIGYLESKHLADRPIVFIEDTKAFVRPTSGSRAIITINKGTIGFIISEKVNWVQVYIGKVKGKWINKHWVNGGYSVVEEMVQEAKEYESAILLLNDDKTEKKSQGKEKLNELSNGTSVIAEMAKEKLMELDQASNEKTSEDTTK